MSLGIGIPLSEALEIFSFLKGVGIKGEIAGSVHKAHAVVHDIDIVCRECEWEHNWKLVQALNGNFPVPVEFYIADEGCFDRLLVALRASRYEVIKGRLMAGLRFRKREWTALKED